MLTKGFPHSANTEGLDGKIVNQITLPLSVAVLVAGMVVDFYPPILLPYNQDFLEKPRDKISVIFQSEIRDI